MSAFTVGRSSVGGTDALGGSGTSIVVVIRRFVRRARHLFHLVRPWPRRGREGYFMADTVTTTIGPYRKGEIPEPADIYVTDDTGTAIDLSAATGVTFKYSVNGGVTETGSVAVQDGPNGVLRITWGAGAFDTAGVMRGVLWYTLGTTRPVAADIICGIIEPPVTIS